MKDLLSIIVPIYNSEKYLETCLNSIVSQMWENYELILINDGSTDNSGLICDNFSNIYDNITVIHKKNEGVSIARNLGLEIAKGKYIVFCDADDIIDKEIYNVLISTMNNNNVDFCACKYTQSIEEFNNKSNKNILLELIIADGMFEKILEDTNTGGFLWNKVFLREIIQANPKIRFDEDIFIQEDELFVLKYLCRCRLMYYIDNVYYYYRENLAGALHQNISNRQLSTIDANTRIFNILESCVESNVILNSAWNRLLHTYSYYFKKVIFSKLSDKKKIIDKIAGYYGVEIFKSQKYYVDRSWTKKQKIYLLFLKLYFLFNNWLINHNNHKNIE